MKRHGAALVLVLVGALLAGGLTVLFRLRLAQGDVFPAYSTLRADPLGTRALHDSLAQLPGLRVERHHRPLVAHEPEPARTLIFAGWSDRGMERLRREDFDALSLAVRSGSRLVIALRAHSTEDVDWSEVEDAEEAIERAERKRDDREAKDAKSKLPKVEYANLRRSWGVEAKTRVAQAALASATRTDHPRTAHLPAELTWRSELYFETDAAASWSVLYTRDERPVMIERSWGRGTIVFAADSYLLNNEALQRERETELLTWIVGAHRRVVFDETHLGVMAEPGIAALARRYGLSAAFCTLLLLAALFIWRRSATFVPPPEEPADLTLAYHPAAGLEALLRRAVAPAELAATCVAEWQSTAPASDRARVASALAALPKNVAPADAYNAAVRALKKR